MTRSLPSLTALRAFEAAARHLSFTRAADELAVTQGAVSHQVKALEAQLGLALFHRRHQGLALTTAGADYLPTVRDAFDQLALGTERLRARQRANRLTVSVSPNFATKWLVPRLGRFLEHHPDLDLRVSATLQHIEFAHEEIDLAIRHGSGNWPGLHAVELCREELTPLCSPRLLEQGTSLRVPEDLARYTLIHFQDRDDWRKWLTAAGVEGVDLSRGGVVLDQASMVIEAAVDAQGVALGRTTLAALDLQAGRLIRPFGLGLFTGKAHYIVRPKQVVETESLRRFTGWLVAEAAADQANAGSTLARQASGSGLR